MGFLTYILIVGYSKGTSNQYVASQPTPWRERERETTLESLLML